MKLQKHPQQKGKQTGSNRNDIVKEAKAVVATAAPAAPDKTGRTAEAFLAIHMTWIQMAICLHGYVSQQDIGTHNNDYGEGVGVYI